MPAFPRIIISDMTSELLAGAASLPCADDVTADAADGFAAAVVVGAPDAAIRSRSSCALVIACGMAGAVPVVGVVALDDASEPCG